MPWPRQAGAAELHAPQQPVQGRGGHRSTGTVAERYEYDPYGARQVYISAGTNDPYAMAPIQMPARIEVGGIKQPYGLNEVGHQGLMHDEHVGLIYNRARYRNHDRFLQRGQEKGAGVVLTDEIRVHRLC